jgi:hypothetical protein
MNFEEALKMEERLVPCVTEILMKHPTGVERIDFHACKGMRENNTELDGVLDKLGIDARTFLKNGECMKTQIKTNSRENFFEYGKERKSFTLGNAADISWHRAMDKATRFPDLMLTGYELEEGILRPYALIVWPWLIDRVKRENIKPHDPSNMKTGCPFGWIEYEILFRANVVVPGCYDLSGF